MISWRKHLAPKSRNKEEIWDNQVALSHWGSFFFFFFICLFFIRVYLLYKIMLVSAIPQHESAIGIHVSLPSWTSLPPLTPSYPSMLSQSSRFELILGELLTRISVSQVRNMEHIFGTSYLGNYFRLRPERQVRKSENGSLFWSIYYVSGSTLSIFCVLRYFILMIILRGR